MQSLTPISTYRLQLHASFTLDDAARLADYLCRLGISHLYASPYLQAVPGSMHGYDVVDYQAINAELGGAAAQQHLADALKKCGMGQVLDIVPNHMALAPSNRYWWDVLENGPCSPYARYFDVAWEEAEPHLRNKVLVPILAGQYGRMLNEGKIKLVREGLDFKIAYEGQRLPIAPETLGTLLAVAADLAASDQLLFIAHALMTLPSCDRNDLLCIEARHRDKEVIFALVHRLCGEDANACSSIDAAVTALNNDIDTLDEFLNAQNYRLSWWHTAQQNLGYRRFFDVNTLVGVRVGEESVFAETHKLFFDWLDSGILSGLRIDHPDGLRDPKTYFERLRAHAPQAWIVAEKILGRHETLPESWPVQGTTGYEFIGQMNGLLIDAAGLSRLDGIYNAFTGQNATFEQLCHDAKIAITQSTLGSDVNYLAALFTGICETHREYRDYTRVEIRRAIREVAACFPLYRTYVVSERDEVSDADIACVNRAIDTAKANRFDIEGDLFDFIRNVLLLRIKAGGREDEFIARFQQFTSAVMAKGVEDTAFYQFNRLVGLNEVGCDPGDPVVTLEEFHRASERAQRVQPARMLALTTHDTKRSEDVRARLAVLTESPEAFGAAIYRWSEMTKEHRGPILDRNTEYLYYQTLIGAWPITVDRAIAYMEKATREAKQQTSWVQNNVAFEDALRNFIRTTLACPNFTAEMESFVATIREAGYINSLAQTLLKCTAPGVPDLYQGSELWDLRLVDPDNRTPVDYGLRRKLLAKLSSQAPQRIMEHLEEGLPKLWTIHCALTLRREHPEAFSEEGAYASLFADGLRAHHCIAFLRGDDALVIAPRLPLTLAGDWADTTLTLPIGNWRNVLTGVQHGGGKQKLAELLSVSPVALLVREN